MFHKTITAAKPCALSFFLPIPGHPGYFADFAGNIYSARRRGLVRLKPKVESTGYQHVLLYNGEGGRVQRYVHQLILETFTGPRPTGMLACHTPNPDKANNRADNLAWQTREQNAADSRRDGTMPNPRHKLDADRVREMRRMNVEGAANSEIARKMGVSLDTVRMVLRRETWGWVF